MHTKILGCLIILLALAGCGRSPDQSSSQPGAVTPTNGGTTTTQPQAIDKSCDDAPYPSQQWNDCEQANFAKSNESQAEFANAAFQAEYNRQSQENFTQWASRAQADPSWISPVSGNTAVTPLCGTWSNQCVGDPFQYPESSGSTGADFYANEAEVIPFVFYDQDCARLSGRMWKPRSGTGPFPGIVIQNGSVQAPETVFWWAAQALVRAGYVVMTYDPRGQGRSDFQSPTLSTALTPDLAAMSPPSAEDLQNQIPSQGTNVEPEIYWEGMVNAVDFFRSTPTTPYPHNPGCAATYPTTVAEHNPHHAALDLTRLGIAGHSLGGVAVTVLQSYDAPGADAWPGLLDSSNPIDAVVAWDGIYDPDTGGTGNAGGNQSHSSGAEQGTVPTIVPRLPIMGHNGEYGLTPQPFTEPPDPNRTIANFRRWQSVGLPVYEVTTQGSTHFDFSPLPNFPTTSWCPTPEEGICNGGWTNALTRHYTVAWFDRWLKQPGELGYDDADDRLLDDNGPHGRIKYSFRYASARDYPDRNGNRQLCEDIRAGCAVTR